MQKGVSFYFLFGSSSGRGGRGGDGGDGGMFFDVVNPCVFLFVVVVCFPFFVLSYFCLLFVCLFFVFVLIWVYPIVR